MGYTVETRAVGGAWTPYSSPGGILARGLTERGAKRLVTRLRREEPDGPDGAIEYRARSTEGRPESERGAVVVSIRLPREALARLDARATAAGMSRSAFVASLA